MVVDEFLRQMAAGIEFLRENRLLTSLIENGGLHPKNIAIDELGISSDLLEMI